MNPTFDLDTHRMLTDATDGFALPNASRTRAARDTHAGNDPAVWRQFASMGWIAASRPEQQGGLGMGLRAGAIISQRLGYAGYLEPYVASSVMVVECLSACGPSALPLLEQIIEGNVITVLAWQSDDGRIEPQAASVIVTQVDGSTVLSGTCRYVAAVGDVFLVFAYGNSVPYIFRVPALSDGLVVERETAADGTVLAWLKFDKVHVSPEDLLASGTYALAAMEESLACGIVATAAELLGVMERSLELTLDYLRMRQQFGKAIGTFQVLQHRAVDMWIQKELTRSALRSALDVFDNPHSTLAKRRLAASSAKARASQAALYIAGQSVQLHGAIGFTDEYELGVYVNRALTLVPRYGNAAQHRQIYAEMAAK